MMPDLVGKDRLMNAVGLNSAAFNGAAVVGPAIAGIVLATFGPAACFALNAVSYLAVITALLVIRARSAGRAAAEEVSVLDSLAAGLRFIRSRRLVLAFFALAAIVSLAARPYLQLLPVFARDVLHGDARLYGILMAANGVGALGGSLLTAAFARVPRKGLVLLCSVAAFATRPDRLRARPAGPGGARPAGAGRRGDDAVHERDEHRNPGADAGRCARARAERLEHDRGRG